MEKPSLILDNGTGYSKIGYSGQLTPSFVLPTAITTANTVATRAGVKKSDLSDLSYYIGQEAIDHSASSQVVWPIRHGIIEDWSIMERYWHQCFYKYLHADPSEHFVVLTEPPLNPPENREITAEIMFETFQVKGLHIAVQAVLAIASSWASSAGNYESKLTGTVVDIGDGVTHVVPVADGYVIGSAIKHVPLAGRDITTFVQSMLRAREPVIPSNAAMNTAREVKEKLSYVCNDLKEEFLRFGKSPAEIVQTYTGINPVNRNSFEFEVGPERFLAPELFFNPSMLDSKFRSGVHQLVDQAIQSCPIDYRRRLYGNIVLSGGSTTFKGFGERLQRELDHITSERLANVEKRTGSRPKPMEVDVVSHEYQRTAVWTGASMLASMPQFRSDSTTKEMYDEYGPSVCRHNAVSI